MVWGAAGTRLCHVSQFAFVHPMASRQRVIVSLSLSLLLYYIYMSHTRKLSLNQHQIEMGAKGRELVRRRMPTALELFTSEAKPPPSTCGWMMSRNVRKCLNVLEDRGVDVGGWEEEMGHTSAYMDKITSSLAGMYGWLVAADRKLGDDSKAGAEGKDFEDSIDVKKWKGKGRRQDGLTIEEMIGWAICTVTSRGINGIKRNEVSVMFGGDGGFEKVSYSFIIIFFAGVRGV